MAWASRGISPNGEPPLLNQRRIASQRPLGQATATATVANAATEPRMKNALARVPTAHHRAPWSASIENAGAKAAKQTPLNASGANIETDASETASERPKAKTSSIHTPMNLPTTKSLSGTATERSRSIRPDSRSSLQTSIESSAAMKGSSGDMDAAQTTESIWRVPSACSSPRANEIAEATRNSAMEAAVEQRLLACDRVRRHVTDTGFTTTPPKAPAKSFRACPRGLSPP